MVNSNQSRDYTETLKNKIIKSGADLCGIASVASLTGLETSPVDLFTHFTSAISIAVALPKSVFSGITDRPTPIYNAVYQTANRLLDEIAFNAARLLEKDGFSALPVPASQTLDRDKWYGAISHKAVARMAGLGWQGKSLLLVTREFGPRVRLATIPTDAELAGDNPTANLCGECTACRDACPAAAIKGVGTESHYKNREEALYFSKCVGKLYNEFAKIPDVGNGTCGICIEACPFSNQSTRLKYGRKAN